MATPRRCITLGEGDTPLVRSRRLIERVGCKELYFKLEMCNPTGSFKDRGMVVAVAKAVEAGAKAVICASTGNTSASAAAYAAHCGLEAYVLVPHGRIAQGKLAQAVAHGAKILAIDGNFDEALAIAREISEQHPVALVNSVNPNRIEGQKTAAFEIVEALGDAPDLSSSRSATPATSPPTGGASSSTTRPSAPASKPRMIGWQAAGAAPIVLRRAGRSTRRRSPRRSASATPRRGSWPWARATSPAARSTPSRTRRSSRRTACSARKRASSASPPPRPASPACCR